MAQREYLPFRLVGMTEEELYREIDSVDVSKTEYVDIPSDVESENDSDGKDNDSDVNETEFAFAQLDDNEVLEFEEVLDDAWDAEDLIPSAELARLALIYVLLNGMTKGLYTSYRIFMIQKISMKYKENLEEA